MLPKSTGGVNAAPQRETATAESSLKLFLPWLLERHAAQGGTTEIRIIQSRPSKGIWTGYFRPDDLKHLYKLLRPDADGPRAKVPYGDHPRNGEAQFYFTMQPADPDLYSRSAAEFNKGVTATSDKDIVAYSLFAVDVDPVRKADLSATDKEKCAARAVGSKVIRWFRDLNIDVLKANSGNGYHILVPTIPYKDVAKASADAQTLLKHLDELFSTDKAKVDTTIFNPGRILKLYGTKALKGSDTRDRPHREATILMTSIPDDVDLFKIVAKDLAAYRKKHEQAAKKPVNGSAPGGRRSSSPTGDGWDFETSCNVLEAVLQRQQLPFKAKDKDEGRIFNFKDCPHHEDPDGQDFECAVIVRKNGSFAAKCMHDADASWKSSFKPKIGWGTHIADVLDELGIKRQMIPYKATAGGIVHCKTTRDGMVEVPLTNFTAKIVSDVSEDDCVETKHVFEIEAELRGRTSRFHVAASDFSAMNWPMEKLGGKAVVYAGHGSKDHARAAIQILSGDIPEKTVYTHLGWRQHNGEWVYLHHGGARGKSGAVKDVEMRLTGPFTRFNLPPTGKRQDLQNAIKSSIKLLDVAPDEVTVPLFGAIWRAVVGETDFTLHICGPTGAGKSALAALTQQFWGSELDSGHFPANWSSTANANEGLAFIAKDAILVLDDFAPTGSKYDIDRKHQEADRLLRGQGNNAGRNRMKADTTLRPTRPSRALILSTGEDVPRGQSLQARMLVLEVAKGAVNFKQLMTPLQKDGAAGIFAVALSGFVRWLAGRYDDVCGKFKPSFFAEYRAKATTSNQHKRTPGMVADLMLGIELFLQFANDKGVLTGKDRQAFFERCWLALGNAAAAQKIIQNDSEPAQRYLNLLKTALMSGKAHIASVSGGQPLKSARWGWRSHGDDICPQGNRIGWVDGKHLYLEPNATYAAVQGMAQEMGEALAVSEGTLRRRLADKGILANTDKKRKRLVIRKKLEGSQLSVLHLRTSALHPSDAVAAKNGPK